MKQYKILDIPEDSAWDRRSLLRFVPIWLKVFFQGVWNIIRWIPTIYKDKDWDGYYIYTILQKKIEHQRDYLVKANRHTRIYHDNFWMTIAINLIERVKVEHYQMEYLDEKYIRFGEKIFDEPEWEDFQSYLHKYKNDYSKLKTIKRDDPLQYQAMILAQYRQDKARKFLFRILEEKLEYWWD